MKITVVGAGYVGEMTAVRTYMFMRIEKNIHHNLRA